MTRSELKNFLLCAVHDAVLRDRERFPIGLPAPTIQALDPAEVLVDRVMEEDGMEAVFIKVTFR